MQALVETTPAKVIRFVLQKAPEIDSYCKTRIVDGVLEMYTSNSKFPSNVDYAGNDLIRTCSGDAPFSLAARKNLADTLPKLQAHFETIKNVRTSLHWTQSQPRH